MNPTASSPPRTGLLLPPTYAATVAAGQRPSLRQLLVEWVDAVAFWRDFARVFPALYAAYHFATGLVFCAFMVRHFSLAAVATVMAIGSGIATVYNTVWYHRYCTHRAYRFSRLLWARVFLWTNPVCFREESYVIPHRQHHSHTDQPGDPYGPHLGWLGSYLGTESQQKMKRDLSVGQYDRLARSLDHLGIVKNGYAAYCRTGSVEPLWHWLLRLAFANLFWTGLGYLLAGWWGVQAWLAGVFFYSALVRDFNYRGHGGFFGEQRPGAPLNQLFYGLIAGEWHENHHTHPRLARSGFRWWQVDVPYAIIRMMHLLGMVSHYVEADDLRGRRVVTTPASA